MTDERRRLRNEEALRRARTERVDGDDAARALDRLAELKHKRGDGL